MLRKSLVVTILICSVFALAFIAAFSGDAGIISLDKQLQANPQFNRAGCTLARHSGVLNGWTPQYENGRGVYAFFDPAAECGSPTYPFEISAIWFTLFDPGGYNWPAQLDVVVYRPLNAMACNGPGTELCRYPIVADSATFAYPDGGTFTLPTPCCITEPVFIGLEYTAGAQTSTPSLMFDDYMPADTCLNWMRYIDGTFNEWLVWHGPNVGRPVFTAIGETMSEACGGPICFWEPGDDHKMHYPQLPDEDGWDVNATQPMVLADDFMCMESGTITDVHFWGSWKDGIEGQVVSFFISFHEDIPADPPLVPYSRPGPTLWEREVTVFTATPVDPPTMEGWYDPAIGETLWDNHQAYFQYDICFDPEDPDLFVQDSGTIYWLNISAVVADPAATTWGWKSTEDHWNDDAVWGLWGELNWIDIWEPAEPLVNGFTAELDATGFLVNGFGQGAYGDGWYYYPAEGWWNVWFYDHPYDPERRKTGFIEFEVFPIDAESFIEVAVNWSTDQWSIDHPNDSMPPLPGEDESLYVGRQVLMSSSPAEGIYQLPYEIPDYNPEWVSVDVRGFNFEIPYGIIEHTCQGSLDLAFVITGGSELPEDSGACCYDPTGLGVNSTCLYTTQTYCQQTLGGVFEGVGVPCQGSEACCLPDGSCVMADALCCVNELGGTPQGAGSACTAPVACCFPDGSCQALDPLCCADLGGTPSPTGAPACLGDNDGDGVDDACEVPEDLKWRQAPDLEPTGMDVTASCPGFMGGPCIVLADDFLCTETGPITEVRIFSSWFQDVYPSGDPGLVDFKLSFHTDVPAGVDQPYSHPGELLWIYTFPAQSFDYRPYAEQIVEGFFDPLSQVYEEIGDFTCWEYTFQLPADSLFIQEGTPENPVVYWLDVQAVPHDPAAVFGWKTSTDHWNDDATWAPGIEPADPLDWTDLVYPPGHPWEGVSIDLAFELYGGEPPCDCTPGDANNDGTINVGDGVYIINYVFKGGPAPVPYALCSGDANCDCTLNVGDGVYIINYVFKGGPAPCDCQTWLINCGLPLRK